uniref:Protein kinase domain-containing protein n=1 Tax=Plectus sambesii TaxID=2011161 RepID=A0A914UV43_9BILA
MESERVRATAHYVWKDADTLGCGSFGMVFRGSSKEKGEPVAIKTLLMNRAAGKQVEEQHMREIQLLENIDHPNVVKFIAVEHEISSNGAPIGTKVLVLELADTTLHQELERPENMFGLRDEAFLLLLANVASGLNHLREVHHIMHRDLKPSNILKTVDASGKTLYKLCDFGGARTVINDEEPMYSLVGTVEYLHPTIHEGVIRGREKGYTASCDLWSIGVTLYQAATAKLPFCPTGGVRNNRLLMLQMTTRKPMGAISGSQTGDGMISWSEQLPVSTQLSEGLRPRVTAMLGGLMEARRTEQWSYERFFCEVAKLTRSPPIKLLLFDQARYLYVYETSSIDDFAVEFNRQLDAPIHEYFFWTDDKLQPLQTNAHLSELSSADHPFCFAVDTQCKMPTTLYLPRSRPKFEETDVVDLSGDVEVAKTLAGLAHFSSEETLTAAEMRTSALSTFSRIRAAFDAKSTEIERRIDESKKLWTAMRRQIDPIIKCSSLSEAVGRHLKQCQGSAETIRKELSAHEALFGQMKTQVMTLIVPCPPATVPREQLAARLARSTKTIDDAWMQFRKEKGLFAQSSLTVHELHWHRIAKERVKSESKVVIEVMKEEKSRLKQTIAQLAAPFKTVATALDKLNDRFLSEIQATAAMIDAFQDGIAQVVLEHFSDDHETLSLPAQTPAPVVRKPSAVLPSSAFQEPDINASMKDLLTEATQFREMTQQTAELMKSMLLQSAE